MRVFFYGLFMGQALLEQKGLQVAGSEMSRLDGYDLRIGKRATLAACPGHAVYGVVMDMAREDVEKLYSEVGLREYRPETVTVVLDSNQRVMRFATTCPSPRITRNPMKLMPLSSRGWPRAWDSRSITCEALRRRISKGRPENDTRPS